MISKAIKENLTKASWIRKMFEEGARLKKIHGDENVFDFSIGNPDLQPPTEVIDAIINNAGTIDVHKYMPNSGFLDVRETVAEYESKKTGLEVSADNIIMTVGAAGGLNVALKALLDYKDEVIILAPYFVEYIFYIKNHGGVPVVVETHEDSFRLDIKKIYSAITEKTKAIIINSPNNPTGVIYTKEELDELADVLEDRRQALQTDIVILSDEPYSTISYGVEVPNIMNVYDDVMVINSFSKSASLPGGRIGYIAVHPKFACINEVMAALAFTNRTLGFVNAPAIYQKAVAAAINTPIDVSLYQERRDALIDIIKPLGFTFAKCDGAFYLFVKSPIKDDVEFAKLANEYNVLLVPGTGFGYPGYFRLCYCVEMETIKNSKKAFEKIAEKVIL